MRIESSSYLPVQPKRAAKSNERTEIRTDSLEGGNVPEGHVSGTRNAAVPGNVGGYAAQGLAAYASLNVEQAPQKPAAGDFGRELLAFSKLNLMYEANTVLIDQIDRTEDRYLRMFS